GCRAWVKDQGVLAFGAEAIVVPPLLAEIPWQVVIVGAQVHRPAHARGIEYEAPQVKMAVISFVIARLEGDAQRLRILPFTAQDGDNKANHSHLDLGSFVFD